MDFGTEALIVFAVVFEMGKSPSRKMERCELESLPYLHAAEYQVVANRFLERVITEALHEQPRFIYVL